MTGHPVEYYSYARVMEFVHEIREIFGRAVTRRGRVVARYLISPAAVERIFGDTHEFYVRKSRFFYVFARLVGKLAIVETVAVGVLAPRAYVRLVYAHGRMVRVGALAGKHVLRVRPLYFGKVVCFARKVTAVFAMRGVGVGLVKFPPVVSFHDIFITVVLFYALYFAAPNSAVVLERYFAPIAEIACHAHLFGSRRPHRKFGLVFT